MLDDFMIRAMLAGGGLSLLSGPLGCFLLWKRMAFFGDALAHAALLGVAFSVWLQIPLPIGLTFVCLSVAYILIFAHTESLIPLDTWLGILSYTALASGLLLLSILKKPGLNPDSLLFGDILTVTASDLIWIYGCVLGVALFFYKYWDALLLMILDEELAQTSGVPIKLIRAGFVLILALSVAVSLKLLGALLVPALLLLPPATSAFWSKTPESMALLSIGVSLLSMSAGIFLSPFLDLATGPLIVASGAVFFFISFGLNALKTSDLTIWKKNGKSDGA